jgi:hypothetical protein
MNRSIARWTTAMAAAAVIAVPTVGFAQTSTQPQTPPPQTTQPQTAAPAADQQDAAKQHLTAARNSLSEMTQLPAASQLTGEARTHVSQLISNFNELITTNAEWRASYAKLESNLNALIGSETTDESSARASGTAGAVGTAGSVTLDPAIRAKLIEFRGHLEKFEEAAGGAASTAPAAAAGSAAAGTAAPGTPAAPATGQTPSAPETAPSTGQVNQEEILRHIAAIEAIVGVQATGTSGATGSATGSAAGTGAASTGSVTLTTSQVEQLRTHLAELRRLLNKG